MTRASPWDNEAEGANLIARLIDGRPIPRDVPGAPSGTHDFDIQLDDGNTVALEVTQQAHGGILAQRSLEGKLDWSFSALGNDWVVKVREPADVKALHREIPAVLRGFESDGRDSWLRGRDHLDADTDAILRNLRVPLIYRLGEATPGSVIVGSAPASGATSPELLVGVAEDHANRADNVAKLGAAMHVSERHLLVWVHADFHQLTAAMSFDALPTGRPDLPLEIDAVWIASAFERPAVWRVDAQGWSDWSVSGGSQHEG